VAYERVKPTYFFQFNETFRVKEHLKTKYFFKKQSEYIRGRRHLIYQIDNTKWRNCSTLFTGTNSSPDNQSETPLLRFAIIISEASPRSHAWIQYTAFWQDNKTHSERKDDKFLVLSRFGAFVTLWSLRVSKSALAFSTPLVTHEALRKTAAYIRLNF
jgi:hypothetical protein